MMTAATELGYDVRIRKRNGTRGRAQIVLRAMRPLPLTEKYCREVIPRNDALK
jgi:hypothetical protein